MRRDSAGLPSRDSGSTPTVAPLGSGIQMGPVKGFIGGAF